VKQNEGSVLPVGRKPATLDFIANNDRFIIKSVENGSASSDRLVQMETYNTVTKEPRTRLNFHMTATNALKLSRWFAKFADWMRNSE
jgi:hypothetical protein